MEDSIGSLNSDYSFLHQSEESQDFKEQLLIHKCTYIPYVKYILLLNCFVSFVFYGFNATLEQYFQSTFGLDEGRSGFLTNAFISTNYIFSLIGGIIADEYLGKLQTLNYSVWILTYSTVFTCFFSTLGYYNSLFTWGVLPGLFFVAVGNGAIIPCISAFIGDQFLPNEDKERSTYYSWYYLFTQIGSIVSTFAAPIILVISPSLLFFIFVIILFGTSIAFTSFQSRYRRVPPEKGIYKILFGVIRGGLRFKDRRETDKHWLDKAKRYYSDEDVEDVKTVLRVLQVFLPMPFFWAIYFQIFSLWVFMAENMDNVVFGIPIPPGSITSLNPFMDLILIPLFAKGIYPLIDKVWAPVKPLQKMSWGLYFTVIALLVASAVQFALKYYYLSILWMIPQFFFISCAEITLSVTAIEFAYTQAPKRMKSAMSAAWFFTVAIGNILVAVVALIDMKHVASELLLFALIIFMISGIFVGIAIRYRYQEVNPLGK